MDGYGFMYYSKREKVLEEYARFEIVFWKGLEQNIKINGNFLWMKIGRIRICYYWKKLL